MQEVNCVSHENLSLTAFSGYFGSMQGNLPKSQLNRYITSQLCYQTSLSGLLEQTANSVCISRNSTSDEAEDHRIRIIDERRQRRMISNRESARRSRMRKQRYLDELWSLVHRLRTENHNLLNKLNHLLENHDRIVQENARLKDEASNLHQKIADLQVSNPYTILRDLEDAPCNTA